MKRIKNVDVLPNFAEEKRLVVVRVIITICNHELAAKIDFRLSQESIKTSDHRKKETSSSGIFHPGFNKMARLAN